jgi:hypothetical protein
LTARRYRGFLDRIDSEEIKHRNRGRTENQPGDDHVQKIKIASIAIAALVPSLASATAFTDESAWRAALFNVYGFENFDSLATGSDVNALANLGIKFLPLNDGTQPTVQSYSQTGGQVKSGPNNLLNDRDFTLPGRGPINVTTIDASDFIFGLGLWNVGGDDQLRLTFYDANNNAIETVTSSPAFGFFGIVNAAGAVRAEVDFVGGNGYAPTDDWQAATRRNIIPGAVPEPATWGMMLFGFAAVGAALRRSRKRIAAIA